MGTTLTRTHHLPMAAAMTMIDDVHASKYIARTCAFTFDTKTENIRSVCLPSTYSSIQSSRKHSIQNDTRRSSSWKIRWSHAIYRTRAKQRIIFNLFSLFTVTLPIWIFLSSLEFAPIFSDVCGCALCALSINAVIGMRVNWFYSKHAMEFSETVINYKIVRRRCLRG